MAVHAPGGAVVDDRLRGAGGGGGDLTPGKGPCSEAASRPCSLADVLASVERWKWNPPPHLPLWCSPGRPCAWPGSPPPGRRCAGPSRWAGSSPAAPACTQAAEGGDGGGIRSKSAACAPLQDIRTDHPSGSAGQRRQGTPHLGAVGTDAVEALGRRGELLRQPAPGVHRDGVDPLAMAAGSPLVVRFLAVLYWALSTRRRRQTKCATKRLCQLDHRKGGGRQMATSFMAPWVAHCAVFDTQQSPNRPRAQTCLPPAPRAASPLWPSRRLAPGPLPHSVPPPVPVPLPSLAACPPCMRCVPAARAPRLPAWQRSPCAAR